MLGKFFFKYKLILAALAVVATIITALSLQVSYHKGQSKSKDVTIASRDVTIKDLRIDVAEANKSIDSQNKGIEDLTKAAQSAKVLYAEAQQIRKPERILAIKKVGNLEVAKLKETPLNKLTCTDAFSDWRK